MHKTTNILILKGLKPSIYLLLIPFLLVISINSCSDSTSGPENEPETITSDKAIEALKQVMQDRSLFQSKSSNILKDYTIIPYEDYVTVDLDEEERRRVHFDIGPDGHIIPNADWRDTNIDICEEQNRFIKAAVKRLQFKMYAVVDGYYAFVQYIDVETGKIETQREGEANTLKEAINNAWNQLQVDIKAPAGPCGRLKGVTLFFNSRIQEEYDDVTILEHVEAEFVLEATEEGTYAGSGPIEYIEIVTSVDGSCTFPDGTLNIREFIFETEAGVPTENTALDFEYQNTMHGGSCSGSDGEYVTTWPFNFTGMHMDEWYTEDGESWDGLIIRDWEVVPGDDDVMARKIYDRTETVDNGGGYSTLTEKTTIEIRNNP